MPRYLLQLPIHVSRADTSEVDGVAHELRIYVSARSEGDAVLRLNHTLERILVRTCPECNSEEPDAACLQLEPAAEERRMALFCQVCGAKTLVQIQGENRL